MSNVADLLDPLRYESLSEYTVANLEKIGAGVFTELQTLDHLALLDLITKAYQAVHLPTYGSICIPQSTSYTSVIQEDSKQELDLITAGKNEVYEIMSIFAVTPADYSISSAALCVKPNGDGTALRPIVALPNASQHTQNFQGIIYGNVIDDTGNKFHICPSPLYLNGNDTLSIKTKNTPSSDLTWGIVYRNMVQ
jgi:hypothetical protein